MSTREYEVMMDYLDRPEIYQDPVRQKDLEIFAEKAKYDKRSRRGIYHELSRNAD